MKTDTTGMPGEEAIAQVISENIEISFYEWDDLDAEAHATLLKTARAVLALLPSEKRLEAGRPEPFLPVELEDTADGTDADWNAKALDALAAQLGYGNDFYYPLIGAAQELRQQREAIARSLSPAAGEGGEDKPLAKWTIEELRTELHYRMMDVLGDQSKCVSTPTPQAGE